MNRRKEIIHAYKERKRCGGVYIVTNTRNGKYLIERTMNLESAQNRFRFAVTSGIAFHPKLQQDWSREGAQAFTFTVLEDLEEKPGQSQDEFMDDLKTLEQLRRADLDVSNEY